MDEFAAAEAAQKSLDSMEEELDSMRPCGQNGCDDYALPDGAPFIFGHDTDGKPCILRKYRCGNGHWFHADETAMWYD